MFRPTARPFRDRLAALMVPLLASFQCLAASAASLPSNLNLASVHRTRLAPGGINPVVIVDGGHPRTILPGMTLTPAETVALTQVLSTGTQSIVLSKLGSAVGGSVVLPAGQGFSGITVPRNVTVIDNFASGASLQLLG